MFVDMAVWMLWVVDALEVFLHAAVTDRLQLVLTVPVVPTASKPDDKSVLLMVNRCHRRGANGARRSV